MPADTTGPSRAHSAARRYDADIDAGAVNSRRRVARFRGPNTLMPTLSEAAVVEALRQVQEPELGRDIVTLDMVKGIAIDGTNVAFTIELTTPACPLKDEIEGNAQQVLRDLGATDVAITWGAMVRRAAPRQAEQLLPNVKNVIAVGSGKGGVGKSTVSVNLAVALAQAGAAVGLLDADITGPNIPMMLGVDGQPKASPNNKITPLERHGVKCISIQFFVPEGQPIVWRGPLVGGAIQQFLRDVDWGDLDYLVVDLPPGTSDAQLTLAQSVPLGGAVLVTTPQDVALSDVGKALAMFKRLSVPILGLVENMTAFACPHCGELTEIFGRGGGERFCQTHGVDFLGGVPLDVTVRQGGDVGVPAVAQREPGPAARALTSVAGAVAARMSVRAASADKQPLLSIS
jgi:ATP-binding protein involved in chromosome partitioning